MKLPKPIRRWLKKRRKARKEREAAARVAAWEKATAEHRVLVDPAVPEVVIDPELRNGVLVVPDFKKLDTDDSHDAYEKFVKSLENIQAMTTKAINDCNATYAPEFRNRWMEYDPLAILNPELKFGVEEAEDVFFAGSHEDLKNHKPENCPIINGFCSICARTLEHEYKGNQRLASFDSDTAPALDDQGKPVKRLTGKGET